MFKIFKSITNKAVDTAANPMADISQAKASTKRRDDARLIEADYLLKESLLLIEQFRISQDDSDLLIDASELLEESLKYNHSNGETHFWLAYILFNFGQTKDALYYLKTAEELKPDYPQINMLKGLI
jgi:tetratricopeptide (TPR) repeat protein